MIKQMVGAVLALLMLAGCMTKHQIDTTHQINTTHEIKPIHITLDINLKVDRELDNFFDDIDAEAAQH
jgi:uncharacterized protein YcfL